MGQEKYSNGFDYTEHPNEIDKPLHWKKPRMIFVDSMSDLFHKNATQSFITAVFDTMMIANWHTYQILTKRPTNMKQFVRGYLEINKLDEIPKHIWLGTSVENNDCMWRITMLRGVQCHVKFISFEPLLEDINKPNLEKMDWVIVGGESGSNARPIEESWIKNIKAACSIHKTAFFFKQWGGRWPKEKGALLDGKKHQEFPIIV